VLLASFLLDMIAMVFGMPRALFPELAAETFGGEFALGWLYAAIPIGAAVFGLFSGWLSRLRRQGVVVTFAVITWGAAMVGFGLSAALPVAVLFLALGGAADLVSAVHRGAILQTATTDEMRGRIQGAFTVVVAGGPYLADVVHGWAATAIGASATAAIGGLLVIILAITAAATLPAFWRYIAPAASATNN
jgi:MFS family permease